LAYHQLTHDYKQKYGSESTTEDSRYLCLLGTAGIADQWNSIGDSKTHQAILLPEKEEELSLMPMLTEMFGSMGVAYSKIINPDPEQTDLSMIEGYMLVKEAKGSPFIPAQKDFIEKYDIKSELGFGGFLPTGTCFTCFIFSKETLDKDYAEKLRIIPIALQQSFYAHDKEHKYWKE
jgi:hypothetical protein